MSAINIQSYKPPGPIGAQFINSRGPIDLIMGPAGSGKTVASVIKGPLLAAQYMPICKDGVVRVKLACIRDTYRDFARTALSSWYDMFPIDHPWTVKHEGGQDRPIRHNLKWRTMRGGQEVIVDFRMETGAVADQNVEQFIKGYEISMFWGNECDMLDERVMPLGFQRTGRYPKVEDIAPQELERVSRDGREQMRKMGLTVSDHDPVLPRVAWGDFNPPDVNNWTYKVCVKEKRPGFNLFKQPGGLSSQAENRIGKPRSSYEMEAATQPEHITRRMVHGEFGYLLDGKPVYSEFNHSVHVADQPIAPVEGIPISIGLDSGGSPAATIGQFMPNGQNRLLREVCTDPGTGPSRFGDMVLELLMREFQGIPVSECSIDPSAFYGADRVNNEFSFVEALTKAFNIPVMPAPSQEVALRHEAVRWYLTGMIDANTPRMLIDPRCERIIDGFAAHYKLTKQASAGETDKLVIAKNMYSHPHDAEQYRCLTHRGRAGVVSDAANLGRSSNVVGLHKNTNPVTTANKGKFDIWAV